MKKEKTVEVYVCDECGSEECVHYHCIGCGKDLCYDCAQNKKLGVNYDCGVNFSSGSNGFFCQTCNIKPPDHVKKILGMYKTIIHLRTEEKTFYTNWKERGKFIEGEIEKEYKRVKALK